MNTDCLIKSTMCTSKNVSIMKIKMVLSIYSTPGVTNFHCHNIAH